MSATGYVTSEVLKATLGIAGSSYADDDMDAAIASASRVMEKMCNRRFWLDDDATSVRYYSPDGPADRMDIDDLVVLTSITSDEDGSFTFANTWTLNTDFILNPLNAAADGE